MQYSLIIPLVSSNPNIIRTLNYLDSELSQTSDLEVIIVISDCSPELLSKIESFEQQHSDSVILVKGSNSSTVVSAIQTALSYCSADYTLFLMPGDILNDKLLQTASKFIRTYQLDLFSFTQTYIHPDFDMSEDEPFYPDIIDVVSFHSTQEKSDFLASFTIDESFFCHICKTSLLSSVSLDIWQDCAYEDITFGFQLFLHAAKIAYTREHGYIRFFDTQSRLSERIVSRMKAQLALFGHFKENSDCYFGYSELIDAHFVLEYYLKNLFIARAGQETENALNLATFQIMQYTCLQLIPKWIENQYIFAFDQDKIKLLKLLYKTYASTEAFSHTIHENCLVSVIITTYNRAGYIKTAIECILRQTWQNFELIIIDDGSTDNTSEIVASFDDPRINFYSNETNKGVSFSRNEGIKKARGEYIVYQDDDDFCRLDKLEKQVSELLKMPSDYSLAYSEAINHAYRIKGITDVPALIIPGRDISQAKKEGYIFPALLPKNFITLPSIIFKKSFMIEAGLFNEALFAYEDWEITLKLAKEHRIAFIPEPLYDYYQRSGSLISKQDEEHRSKVLAALYSIDKEFESDRKQYGIETSFKVIDVQTSQ